MKTKRLLTTISFIVIVVAFNADSAQLNFDPSRGLVELEATVNGYLSGRFGIDTGADNFYLDKEFAKRASVAVNAADETMIVRGIDGFSPVGQATLRSLDIQGERIYNVPVDVVDLNALTEGKWKAPDGLLGYSVLHRFYVTIDYPSRTLELYSQEINYSADEVVGVPFFLQGHLIVVDVSIDGSQPLKFFLDYCASMSIITPSAAERIGKNSKTGEYQVAGVMKIVGIDESSSSDVTLYTKALNELGESENFEGIDGILGYSFLASHKITIDYRRDILLFHHELSHK